MAERKPIEEWMHGVEWEPVPKIEGCAHERYLPHTTHAGILRIANFEMRVYRLSDGLEAVNLEDLTAFWEGMAK